LFLQVLHSFTNYVIFTGVLDVRGRPVIVLWGCLAAKIGGYFNI